MAKTGLWRFDGNGNDYVSSNNSTVTAGTYVAGKSGQSVQADGSTTSVSIPTASFTSTGPFCIGGWYFLLNNTQANGAVLNSMFDNATDKGIYIFHDPNNGLGRGDKFSFWCGNVSFVSSTISASSCNGKWNRIFMQRDGSGNCEFWVNGKLDTSFTNSGTFTPNTGIAIQSTRNNQRCPSGTRADEVVVYNQFLTPAQMKNDYAFFNGFI